MATSNNSRSKDNYKNRDVRRSFVANSLPPSTTESNVQNDNRINSADDNYETVVFIWFDPHENINTNLVGPLRMINDNVQTFTDSLACFDILKSSQQKLFLISSSTNNELIATVHSFVPVEAIFILNQNGDNIKGDFPKLFGIFTQQEELFRMLKEVYNTFEEVQLEEFTFEQDLVFLWSQLWKEDLRSRKISSNKAGLISLARRIYRDNPRIIETIEELEKSYRASDVITWCFRSPFPTRLLLHALRSHNKARLSVCRFLYADASRFFQQHAKHKSTEQVYRGMKLSNELLAKFETHVGQVICTSGFFPCTKSRKNALTLASLPAYRPDLQPVLFKVDCDASSLFIEIPNKNSSPKIAFDVCTTFRIVYVNRGPMSIIKLKTTGEAGKKFALDYLENHPNETIQSLVDELLKPLKPPTPPPPPLPPPRPRTATLSPPRIPTPPPQPKSADLPISADEMKAQKYVEQGDIDLALINYRRIQPTTARILNAIGLLCADKKGDYNYALQCHQQALKLQEESNEDISDTLTYLGNVYHSRGELDLTLEHHRRALTLRQKDPTTETVALVSNFIGVAKCHLARREHSEAINNAERALALQEVLVPLNEASIGATLILLGNIYQDSGDNIRALEMCTKALPLLERTVSDGSSILAELFFKLGTMQSSLGALTDAQRSLERSYKIYKRLVPRGHEDRMLAENELRRVLQLRQNSKQKSQTNP
ncbi:unnamed protein product [Rotaria socialis]|uniref:Uncharacterized protein n=1 Tax=Rotaria socialis TaxID=392032 RepID=A0A820Q5I1_9BILA|nr:unnamed protein product [Rotaria socialis]CAF3361310.1 unnamed protein product [Rotaria socialis]CAF3399876.1 unnamed protein product [Rotaria socialis]CAF4417105.1 unnamed protein product [Rotaria socialis]CAF4585324.1 unnamed protein product [Rotaria socialis]